MIALDSSDIMYKKAQPEPKTFPQAPTTFIHILCWLTLCGAQLTAKYPRIPIDQAEPFFNLH